MLKDTRDGLALVTGASSGIGAAIVRRLREGGREVVATARRADRLEALARETGCRVEALDMRDVAKLEAFARELAPAIIVNNAGSGQGFEGLVNTTEDEIATALATNVAGPLNLARAALPAMISARRGHIVNIGSIAGLYPINNALYAATKGAVHLMSQNLRIELKGTGIRVTEIAPGRVATDFFDVAGLPDATRDKIKNTGITELTADDVASTVMFALDAPAHMNVSLIELTPTEQSPGGVHLVPHGPPAT